MLKILFSRHVYIIYNTFAIRMHWNDKYICRRKVDIFLRAQIFHTCLFLSFPFHSIPIHSFYFAIVFPSKLLWWDQWKNFALIIIWIRNIRFPFYFIIRWNLTIFCFFTPVSTTTMAATTTANISIVLALTHSLTYSVSNANHIPWNSCLRPPIFLHCNQNACLFDSFLHRHCSANS